MDKQLVCKHCSKSFMFSEAEQEFFRRKGLTNEPKSCYDCRLISRNWRKTVSGETARPIVELNCARCGESTKVPFEPRGYGPVFCRTCFFQIRQATAKGPDQD
jgi:CxxC-x17-CxxC domain-containing protein